MNEDLGRGFSLGAIHDPELGIASCRVYNDWMPEYCAADPRRLVGTAALVSQTWRHTPR